MSIYQLAVGDRLISTSDAVQAAEIQAAAESIGVECSMDIFDLSDNGFVSEENIREADKFSSWGC